MTEESEKLAGYFLLLSSLIKIMGACTQEITGRVGMKTRIFSDFSDKKFKTLLQTVF